MSAADEMRRRARQHALADEHEEAAEATALADLLDSIDAALPWIDSTPGRGATAAVLRQRKAALEAAIDRSGT